MRFNSLVFAPFAALTLGGHALLEGRVLRTWLVIASYVFYGWGDYYTCGLLLFSTVLDYTAALRIHASEDPRVRKAWLLASLTGNLGLLALFKYSGMVLRWADALALAVVGVEDLFSQVPGLAAVGSVGLPVGISFYTFQTLSYTIDVYRGRMEPSRRFSTVALYVAFFPQLVAGPIERASHLMPQLERRPERTADDLIIGTTRVLWGLVKKVVFADWLGVWVATVWGQPEPATGWELFLALHAFSFQLYLDFSAYSDIAIGLSRFMGIRLRENFRWPFLSRDPLEFWTRWHISLTTWVRDYVYYPLGGSQRGRTRGLLNSLVVMIAIGLWHGADEKFIIWGIAHWVYETLYRGWSSATGRPSRRGQPHTLRDIPAVLLTYLLVIPQVFFGAPSMAHARVILAGLFRPWGPPTFWRPRGEVVRTTVLVAIAMAAHVVRGLGWDRPLHGVRSPWAVGGLWAMLVALLLLAHAPVGQGFYYFRF